MSSLLKTHTPPARDCNMRIRVGGVPMGQYPGSSPPPPPPPPLWSGPYTFPSPFSEKKRKEKREDREGRTSRRPNRQPRPLPPRCPKVRSRPVTWQRAALSPLCRRQKKQGTKEAPSLFFLCVFADFLFFFNGRPRMSGCRKNSLLLKLLVARATDGTPTTGKNRRPCGAAIFCRSKEALFFFFRKKGHTHGRRTGMVGKETIKLLFKIVKKKGTVMRCWCRGLLFTMSGSVRAQRPEQQRRQCRGGGRAPSTCE